MTHVMPTLTKGLIECCKQKPEDPIDYLVIYYFVLKTNCFKKIKYFKQAEYLFKHNPQVD